MQELERVIRKERSIRLAGGNETAGRVEIYLNGEWGTVCDDAWDINDANVVCNQLGFAGALDYRDSAAFEEGSIRLAGGNETAGRVEIYLNGEWGTVCDDEWDIHDAHVVCNELGFPGALGYRTGASFGEGTGEIYLDDVGCDGEETELLSCYYNSIDNCNHGEDAGVICELILNETTPEEGSIRLAGGIETAGRVEIFLNREWGTVCDDAWDINDAKVVCNQLGFARALESSGSAAFGEGTGKIHLDDVGCGGEETELLSCYYNSFDNCNHGEDASVICQLTSDEPTPEEGSIRLAGGNETAGRVEIYLNGEWGTVCDDKWDINDANVVCNQLGLVRALESRGSAAFGEGTGKIHLDDVGCGGEETELLSCYYNSIDNCNHAEDASVICQLTSDEPAPEEGSIRLAGGNETAGRVEIYLNGEWGTVCDDKWDINDANVVCNQLGLVRALESRGSAAFGEGTGKIHLDDVGCGGEETELLSCYYRRIDNCNHAEDASVICQLTSGELRLADEGAYNEGRLLVNLNGQ
ncbi:scavenger receptor cysteine-rich domain-containing protein DMBT1-like [Apostichopus japonicus]|uniref:scavenger receptor cysteine-rich domain-containing protein DMBT1-like n=1 Tax=Stichopus japonicus TaxID=307972 RepID=UPI003AB5D71B